ncbi:unnamed protein product [Rotaria socialis]|uniref:Uncharacterized protein n=1 Tax=Rotaria socialis TaxID=392032 RepID=A0A817YJU8_9BILA|nr:unnamed protein product [Rotaria socialis]CAF4270501.1 unnamed protein product [Rotaria socialis]
MASRNRPSSIRNNNSSRSQDERKRGDSQARAKHQSSDPNENITLSTIRNTSRRQDNTRRSGAPGILDATTPESDTVKYRMPIVWLDKKVHSTAAKNTLERLKINFPHIDTFEKPAQCKEHILNSDEKQFCLIISLEYFEAFLQEKCSIKSGMKTPVLIIS